MMKITIQCDSHDELVEKREEIFAKFTGNKDFIGKKIELSEVGKEDNDLVITVKDNSMSTVLFLLEPNYRKMKRNYEPK